MGFFKPKKYTDEQNKEFLEESGIPVAKGYSRKSKFSAFSQHASQMNSQRPGYNAAPAPSAASDNPYANMETNYNGGSETAAAANKGPRGYTAYGRNDTSYGSSVDPYQAYGDVATGNTSKNSYQNDYARHSAEPRNTGETPYSRAHEGYASRFGKDPLARSDGDAARAELFSGANRSSSATPSGNSGARKDYSDISAADELMEAPSDLNRDYVDPNGEEQEQTLMDSEDEIVEGIKGQIKKTRGDTVQSTRNILDLAARAEESGRNTLGMLGSQAERMANTEQNLALTSLHNNVAEDKAKELKRLNRSIFIPNVSFNSKKKRAQQEQKIRQTTELEQANREARRQIQYESEQRVTAALESRTSEIAQKYRSQSSQADRKKYMFEADSDDEAMEDEIDNNMSEIASASGRLRQLALASRDEVDRQNERLQRIGEIADNEEIKTQLNIHRLANVK